MANKGLLINMKFHYIVKQNSFQTKIPPFLAFILFIQKRAWEVERFLLSDSSHPKLNSQNIAPLHLFYFLHVLSKPPHKPVRFRGNEDSCVVQLGLGRELCYVLHYLFFSLTSL
jgi:hypothetical protein